MANIEAIKKHQFKAGQSGNTNGRPKGTSRSTFAKFKKACKAKGVPQVSKHEYKEALSLLYNLTHQELKELAADKEQPMQLRMMANDLTSTNPKVRADFRNYLFGKATETIKQNTAIQFVGKIEKTNVGANYKNKLHS